MYCSFTPGAPAVLLTSLEVERIRRALTLMAGTEHGDTSRLLLHFGKRRIP